jgi:hypothetical protein
MTVMYTCHCFLAKDICRCCGKYAQPWLSYVNVIQGVTKESTSTLSALKNTGIGMSEA